jgi:HAD superfamily hydrolase (TIGR01509 family)
MPLIPPAREERDAPLGMGTGGSRMMSTKSGKLVIFDCDGVLVDSEPIANAVLREMLADAGFSFTDSWAYENFLGKSMASVTAMMARDYHLELDEAALAAMRQRLYERFEAELEPVHGIDTVLAGFPFAHCVASSSQLERIRLCLNKTGLAGYFEPHIFSASMVANGKPAPDLFLLAARSMGYSPRNCIVIEDSPAGIRAAKAAGMTAFAFTGASHAIASNLRPLLENLKPAVIFDDMAELPALIAASGG